VAGAAVAGELQNLQAEPQKLELATARSSLVGHNLLIPF